MTRLSGRLPLRGYILAFVALLSVTFVTDTRAADGRSIVAVMEIEDGSGKLIGKDLRTATEFLRGRLTATGKFIVIDQSRQAAALKKIVLKSKQESYQECRPRNARFPWARS
jgi:hypothetical protein